MKLSDKTIIKALQNDPEEGFRLLMAHYAKPLYWHIRRLVVSHADAQDATQETLVRIFRNIDKLHKADSFTAWIYRIATNEALRIIEHRQPEAKPIEQLKTDSPTTTEQINYDDIEAIKLQQAILSLPTKQQLTFNLRYYDELSYDQIAAITETTATSAKANYHLAKKRIIEYLQTHD